MKKTFYIFAFLVVSFSCSKDKNPLSQYFGKEKANALFLDMITYMYMLPPYATDSTKFDPEYRKYYEAESVKFEILDVKLKSDSVFNFLVSRPVGGTTAFRRGIIGNFKIKNGKIAEFEEVAATPHLSKEEMIQRGEYLFQEYCKNGNLSKQKDMRHYIEWPDSSLIYDKSKNKWVSTQKL